MYTLNGLFTDFYSLTMMQGYYFKKRHVIATFDMFIRSPHNNIGYMIFAGLDTLISQILSLRFSEEDIAYLRSQNIFHEDFLAYLKTYVFKGSIWAMREGSVCFPQEPLLKIRTSLMDAQLLEGLILNTINFQTLVATKASRICHLTKEKKVVELGLRRAQGPNGALYASRAAYIGGVSGSSNTEAGKIFGIPVIGTMAHSWVMSYQDERKAFEDFAEVYENSNISFILDTYDTLQSGIKNAITVGKTLRKKGVAFSVRLDSGDLEYLSQHVRRLLDEAGLHSTKIIATNDLDEDIIAQILSHNAPIDVFGIGTNLVTGGNISALPGVYKIAELFDNEIGEFRPLIKTSNDIEKSSLPSFKQTYRFSNREDNLYVADLITEAEENILEQQSIIFHHPFKSHKRTERNNNFSIMPLLHCYVENGVLIQSLPSIQEIQSFAKQELSKLDKAYLRHLNPHEYYVSISHNLKTIRDALLFRK